MLTRLRRRFAGIAMAALMLGIGTGIGSVGGANASTAATAVSNVLQAAATSIKCATVQACFTATNSAKGGVAILGSSPNGLGIEGSSTTSSGVTGTSQSSNGVNGKSSTGYAVQGVSASSDGVVGTSNGGTTSIGVLGRNTGSGTGVQASSITGSALVASNNGFNPFGGGAPIVAINGTKSISDAIDIETTDDLRHSAVATTNGSGSVSTGIGDDGSAIDAYNAIQYLGGFGRAGYGISGSSAYGDGLVGEADNAGPTAVDNNPIPVSAVSANAPNGADLYLGFGKAGTFEVTNDGNVYASGTIASGVTCAPTTCPSGTKLTSYASRDASPTMEDFGRTQLVNGAAVVRFDSAFAGTIDATKDYYVFLTPEGDSRGLYVTRRTPLGFAVGESQNGHSTLAFSYRIVASPYGTTAQRLPVLGTPRLATAANARRQADITALRQKSTAVRARMAKLPLSEPTSK
jgi:hypothetical protein